MVQSKEVNADSFVKIAAGASLEATVDIAEIFDLSASGKYTVSTKRIHSTGHKNQASITGATRFNSNELTIDVDAKEAAKVKRAMNSLSERTQVTNTCSSQQQIISSALSTCASMAQNAAQAAQGGDASKFQEYFLQSSAGARQQVASRFQSVAQECSSETSGATTYYCSDPYGQCQSNYIAYTFPAQNIVVMCPYFWRIPAIGSSCHQQDQAYIPVHEFTHASGVVSPPTGDSAYGYENIRRLSPAQALQNADTYGLYALGEFPNSFLPVG